MNALPPPLDNLYVLISVIILIVILIWAVKNNRDASKRLDATRKEKARLIREAKLAVKNQSKE